MNDLSSLTKNIEEVMRKEDRFPIDFEAGSPFGVTTRASITETTKNMEEVIQKESTSVGPDMMAGECDIVDEQLERWLSKLGDVPRNAFVLNNIGTTYLSKGDAEAALKCFGEALAVSADFRPAIANMAKAYMLQGKLDEALAICVDEESKHATDISLLMTIAQLHFRRGEIQKAKKKLDDVITLDPRKSLAYHNRGVIRLLSNQVNEAIRDLREAISLDERSAQTHNALGICHVLRKSYDKAIKSFLVSLNIDKTNMRVLKNLATAYELGMQFREAADLMEKHLSSYPMDSGARDIAALSYLNLKEYPRCMSHLRYQIQNKDELKLSDSDLARVWNNMGVVESCSRRFEEALGMYKSSLGKCDESHAHIVYTNLLKTYLALGRVPSASSLLDEYTRKGLKNNWPFIVFAIHYYRHDEYAKSRDLLKGILEREDENIAALQLLSSIYIEAFDDVDKSLELAERAYKLRPSDQNVANNLAYSYVRKGLVSEAKDILEKRKWDKNYFFALATKGLVKLTEGYVDEGINLYNEAERLACNTEWRRLVRQKKHVEVARHYLNRGKLQEAQKELTHALSIKPNMNLYRHQAEGLLDDLQQHRLI